MKLKYPINLHKFLTFLYVFGLMVFYQNFTTAAWVYLALHGTYGIMWLIKDNLYPDKQWEQKMPVITGIFTFVILGLYFGLWTRSRLKKDEYYVKKG